MKIAELFRRNIARTIEEVVKVDLADEAVVSAEIDEYVVTERIRESFEELLEEYRESILNPTQRTTIWVSGFFGSGKSSFAKMLGYLVSTETVAGARAATRILERVGSKKLEALIDAAQTNAPTLTVFLDLSTGRNVLSEGESIALPMYRALLEKLGYSRNFVLAELEYVLEKDGELSAFESKFAEATGHHWADRRDVIIARNEASKALHLLHPDTYPSADSWSRDRETPEINHNWFASRALELLTRRGGGAKRLLFVVDEVGQYVARSIDRMLDLQGVAEAFQKKQGPAWLLVTSQEKLEDVVDSLESKRIELARAKDRFPHRIDLLPSDIYEVASKRVLEKDSDGQALIRSLFEGNRNKLATNLRLEAPGRDTSLVADDFVRLYPLVPYHVDLLIDAVSARRAQGPGSAILGGSNRTIIKLAQQLIIDPHVGLAAAPVGDLVTLDRAAALLESILPTAWQGEIAQVQAQHGEASTHAQVMRTVALTSDVKALPLTTGNLAALLHPSISAESRRGEIEGSAETLLAEDRLRVADDGFHIQSPEQKDWERLRRGKEPTPADAVRIRKQLLRQALTGLSVTHGRVFKVELSVEGERLTDGEVALAIDEAAAERREELRALSRETANQDRITWAFSLADDTYDATIELHRSNEMIRLRDTPSKTQTDLELLAGERRRQHDAERRTLERLTRDLLSGQTIFRGQIEELAPTGGLMAAARAIVDGRISSIYPRLHEFAATTDAKLALTLLRADDLSGLPPGLGDEGIGLTRLTPEGTELQIDGGPLADLIAVISRHASYGEIASGALLEKEFAKPPRGAALEIVQILAAAAVRSGRVEVTYQGARIASPSDARLDRVFGTVPAFRAAAFAPAPASGVPIEDRVELAERLSHILGSRPPVDVGGLAGVLRNFLTPDIDRCTRVSASLTGAGIAVPETVTNTQNVVSSLPSLSDAEVVSTVHDSWADLISGRDAVAAMASTLDQDLETYRSAAAQVRIGESGLEGEDASLVKELRDLLSGNDVLTHQAEIRALTGRLTKIRRDAYSRAAAELTAQLEEARRDLVTRFASVPSERIGEVVRALDALRPDPAAAETPLAVVLANAARLHPIRQKAERQLEDLEAEGRMAWVNVATLVPATIESEEQLEPALRAIREAVEEYLADDKHVRLT